MASNAGEYRDNEVNILTGVYERGLRSKVKHKNLLEEARVKTGLTSERIMVFFFIILQTYNKIFSQHLHSIT